MAHESILVVDDQPVSIKLMRLMLEGTDKAAQIRYGIATHQDCCFSADASTHDDMRIIAAGCDGFIPKPIDTRTLAASIREYLDK